MSLNAITVLLPIFFVLGLGYVAGRTKKFDADQVQGISYLVLHYAMPAMMFVATVSTKRSEMLAEGPFLMALLGAFVGLFIVVVLFSVFVLHHSLGEAALQANLISYPSVAFIGPPIFQGLFGGSEYFFDRVCCCPVCDHCRSIDGRVGRNPCVNARRAAQRAVQTPTRLH